MEKKKYHKFGNQYLLLNLFLFIPGVYFFWKAWCSAETGDSAVIYYTAIFLSLVVAMVIFEKIWFNNFRCPRCGKKITEQTIKKRKSGDPRNFFCKTCDIEWITGISESSD